MTKRPHPTSEIYDYEEDARVIDPRRLTHDTLRVDGKPLEPPHGPPPTDTQTETDGEQKMDNSIRPAVSPYTLEELDGLNLRQYLFSEAYLGEARGNATKAARVAGYSGSDNVLATTGRELLRNPHIKSRIQARLNEVGLSTTAILHELAELATAPTSHFMIQTREEMYDQDGKKIRDAQFRLDYGSKVRCLELLMRFHRMLDERAPVEVTIKALVGVDINRI
jgi:hypothetical protein